MLRLRRRHACRLKQRVEGLRPSGAGRAHGIDPAQVGQAGQINSTEQRAIADERDRAGVFQLIVHLARAVGGVQRSGRGAGQHGRMIGDAELPAVGQEDADHLSRTNAGSHQAACRQLHHLPIGGIGDAAFRNAGGVNDRDLGAVPAAGVQNHIVDELAFGIVEQPGP